MRGRPPLLVSAGIIHRNRRVLVGQRRKSDRHSLKWEFPGGKVEQGETPRRALIRELWEELCIHATIGSELARYQHQYPNGSRIHLLFFAVVGFSGEPAGTVFERISWVNLEELAALDFLEGDLDFIRRLARGDFSLQLAY
jgi:8-oxo-dGTP diphosphatase